MGCGWREDNICVRCDKNIMEVTCPKNGCIWNYKGDQCDYEGFVEEVDECLFFNEWGGTDCLESQGYECGLIASTGKCGTCKTVIT
jgi:hypothetical protein